MQLKKIMIMAGGTGGHVFPGIALADELRSRQVGVVWLGTAGGLEKNWVEQAGIEFEEITIQGLRGKGLLGWLVSPFRVLKALLQARKIMQQHKPDAVLGMGGFVCGPGGLAAKSLGLPLFIHEQNAIAGFTNKLLAPLSNKVFCGFKIAAWEKGIYVGNPVRAEIEAVPAIEETQAAKILVIGGSRGALALNQLVPQALKLLDEEVRPQVLHQTGTNLLEQTQAEYAGLEAEVVPFISDMAQAYKQATLVISRAGALTVAELMAAGRPAILVPFPFAVDDHQTANAEFFVQTGGATVAQQKDLNPEILADLIKQNLYVAQAAEKSKLIKSQAVTQSAKKLVDVLAEDFG